MWNSIKDDQSPADTAQELPDAEKLVSRFMAALHEVQHSGRVDPALEQLLTALTNAPQQLAALAANPQMMQQLEAAGLNEIGSEAPLEIADYYRDEQDTYTLLWPLDPSLTLPVPFEQLDRETQFFVLFQEWTRREMVGMAALNSGQVDEAESIFQECLRRAEQIDVVELKARSYEGVVRVAQKRGDRQAERHWNQAAQQARLAE